PMEACRVAKRVRPARRPGRQEQSIWRRALAPPPLPARHSMPCSPLLFLRRRLPELDLVAVRIDEPAEASVLVLLDLADDLGAAEMHLTERTVEIVDDEIEHEFALRRREVIGVCRKRAPDGEAASGKRV